MNLDERRENISFAKYFGHKYKKYYNNNIIIEIKINSITIDEKN